VIVYDFPLKKPVIYARKRNFGRAERKSLRGEGSKETVKLANIGKLERLTGNETMLVIIISEHVRRGGSTFAGPIHGS